MMKFCMLFHLLFSTLRSNQYSLSCSKIMPKIGHHSQWHNQYWLDRKVENCRSKSMQKFMFYLYIILWYDQNSNTWLESTFWVGEIVEPAKRPWVQWGSVFWWGKTCFNGSSLVRTRTRYRTTDLKPLLTLLFVKHQGQRQRRVNDSWLYTFSKKRAT